MVSAGGYHTVLLRSDGRAVACGERSSGECDIPTLDEGTSYIQAEGYFCYSRECVFCLV